jgi:hypothetical protein
MKLYFYKLLIENHREFLTRWKTLKFSFNGCRKKLIGLKFEQGHYSKGSMISKQIGQGVQIPLKSHCWWRSRKRPNKTFLYFTVWLVLQN